MANHSNYTKQCYTKERVDIDFTFVPNTAGTPATASFDGDIDAVVSVVWTATGRYTITLKDAWIGEPTLTPTLALASSAVDGTVTLLYTAASKTIEVRYRVAGTLTDLANTAGNRLGFKGTFRNCVSKH